MTKTNKLTGRTDRFIRIDGVLRNIRFLTTAEKLAYLGHQPRVAK